MQYAMDSERCSVLDQVMQETMDLLAAKTEEERLAWFRHILYDEPLIFLKEIGGTVYAVRSLFEADADEDITEKVVRILSKTDGMLQRGQEEGACGKALRTEQGQAADRRDRQFDPEAVRGQRQRQAFR